MRWSHRRLVITLVFFFWPASQAMYWSLLIQDAFAASTQFVWFDNFRDLFNDPRYLASFQITAVFSVLVTVIGLAVALLLAVFADRVVRGAQVYKTLLIWPYAVAAAVAGGALAVPAQSDAWRRSRTCCARWATTGITC